MLRLDRRAMVAAFAAAPALAAWPGTGAEACPTRAVPQAFGTRALRARLLRTAALEFVAAFPQPRHENNGEERAGPDGYPAFPYQANYTKALLKEARGPDDPRGSDVSQPAYRAYLAILEAARVDDRADFCAMPIGGRRKQTNPQGGVAFDLEGFDPQSVNLHLLFRNSSPNGRGSLRPAPRIDGLSTGGESEPDHENAAEMIEVYWMALMRDVHFGTYRDGGSLAAAAALDLDVEDVRDAFHVTTPYPTVGGRVTPATLFRGSAPGDNRGPYVSQFLLRGSTLRNGADDADNPVIQRPEKGLVLHGTQLMDQRQRHVTPGVDYLGDVASWRAVQSGARDPTGTDRYETAGGEAAEPKFIRNLRDLATWVHLDYLYQHFLNAALILLYEPALAPDAPSPPPPAPDGQPAPPQDQQRQQEQQRQRLRFRGFSLGQKPFDAQDFRPNALPSAPAPLLDGQPGQPAPEPPGPPAPSPPAPAFPLDPGNPYGRRTPQNMRSCDGDEHIGFVTFGGPHVLTLLAEVTTRALKAAWFQKWYVHRRGRPEEFGGLVHFQKLAEQAAEEARQALRPVDELPYPCIDRLILDAGVLARVEERNRPAEAGEKGTYLLPQVFPEGSPTHPAYPSGHATAAGACATILKAWFDEAAPMTDPTNAIPTDPSKHPLAFQASPDGSALAAAVPAEQVALTVGGELNKLASNIGIGRNGAGVHWRSDATEGMKLGEAVAAGILFEQAFTFEEEHSLSFTTFFTGERVTIGRRLGAGGRPEVFVRFVDVDHAAAPGRDEVGQAQEEVFPVP